RRTALRVPEARLLNDRLPRGKQADLARDLVLDGMVDELEAVDVLELDLGPELGVAGAAHGNVGVASERAFLHVAVGDPEPANELAKRAHGLRRLVGARDVRLGHDLDEGHARAVEIDERAGVGVDVLARVLLEMDAREADAPFARKLDVPALAQRLVVLRD